MKIYEGFQWLSCCPAGADPRAEFEPRILEKTKIEDFKSRLSDADHRILELRAAGYSQQEIADRVGFKAPSAVSKRIRQMAKLFDDFIAKEYGEFTDRRIDTIVKDHGGV